MYVTPIVTFSKIQTDYICGFIIQDNLLRI